MLEIPHPEGWCEPHNARALVLRVCPPDTADERRLHISVQLEISGNVWEMAFPPSDWFAFAESEGALAETPSSSVFEPCDALPAPPNTSAGAVELAADRPAAAILKPNAGWFESVVATYATRLQAALDAIGQQIITDLSAQLERELSSHFDDGGFSRSRSRRAAKIEAKS